MDFNSCDDDCISCKDFIRTGILTCLFDDTIFRVPKYAKFGLFYAKIVQMTPLRLWRESLPLQKFSVTNIVLSLPFLQQIQFTLIIFILWYRTAKQEGGKLWSKFTRWPPSWIWAFQVSGPPHLFHVSLTIVYTRPDHVLESLKMVFFVVILDSKYSKMTPKFVKQKSHWLHSSVKFANPAYFSKTLKTSYNTTPLT